MIGRMVRRRFAVMGGLAATLVVTGMGGSIVLADDDAHGHGKTFGAWLYEGTCDTLAASPLVQIGDLEIDDDGDAARDLALTPPAPSTIWTEDEDFNGTYASLAQRPHAVVVRASEDPASDAIACGEIANVPADNEAFGIDLKTVNGSGYTGIARFRVEPDDGGNEVEIAVGIWEGTSGATPMVGTPAA
ncbi:MAG: hypothetical protein QM589_18465 [Thermomicrobiales bacterium]